MAKEKYDLEVYWSGMAVKMAMFASRPIIITKYIMYNLDKAE